MANVGRSGKIGSTASSKGKAHLKVEVAKTARAAAPPAGGETAPLPARRRTAKAAAAAAPPARRYLKGRAVCRVTFRLPSEAAPGAQAVHIAGDFNGWDFCATPLDRHPSGDYRIVVDLEAGREYRFRYLIDGCRWENDWSADRYEPNPFGGFDSVVVV